MNWLAFVLASLATIAVCRGAFGMGFWSTQAVLLVVAAVFAFLPSRGGRG